MNCPACGSLLKEHKTAKSAVFLVCTKWPACKVSGTPELLERLERNEDELRQALLWRDETTVEKPVVPIELADPVPLGSFIRGVAQLRIHQSKLRGAKTAEERETIRKQALEAMR